MKNLLELKERAEEIEAAALEKAQELEKGELLELGTVKPQKKQARLEKCNLKLLELYMKAIYNPRYTEEIEEYLRYQDALKAYNRLLNYC